MERRLLLRFSAAAVATACVLGPAEVVFGQQPEGDFLVQEQGMAPFYFNGNPHEPYVSLTVDDCWNIENTKRILEMARDAQVPLTFFPGAYQFLNYPSLWQEVLLSGHEIENHTVNHFALTVLDEAQILDQIDKTQQYFQQAIGQYRPKQEIPPIRYIRPPWGTGFVTPTTLEEEERKKQEKRIRQVVFKRNLEIVLWSHFANQVETIDPGAIVLFHTNNQDLVALKRAIKLVKDRNLIPVTINELLNPAIRRHNRIKFERTERV